MNKTWYILGGLAAAGGIYYFYNRNKNKTSSAIGNFYAGGGVSGSGASSAPNLTGTWAIGSTTMQIVMNNGSGTVTQSTGKTFTIVATGSNTYRITDVNGNTDNGTFNGNDILWNSGGVWQLISSPVSQQDSVNAANLTGAWTVGSGGTAQITMNNGTGTVTLSSGKTFTIQATGSNLYQITDSSGNTDNGALNGNAIHWNSGSSWTYSVQAAYNPQPTYNPMPTYTTPYTAPTYTQPVAGLGEYVQAAQYELQGAGNDQYINAAQQYLAQALNFINQGDYTDASTAIQNASQYVSQDINNLGGAQQAAANSAMTYINYVAGQISSQAGVASSGVYTPYGSTPQTGEYSANYQQNEYAAEQAALNQANAELNATFSNLVGTNFQNS